MFKFCTYWKNCSRVEQVLFTTIFFSSLLAFILGISKLFIDTTSNQFDIKIWCDQNITSQDTYNPHPIFLLYLYFCGDIN